MCIIYCAIKAFGCEDKYNNIIANEELYEYINKLDDYEKFEIKKYL